MQPLELGNLVKLTAQTAGVSEKTVQRICLEGVANEGAFGSPKKWYTATRRKTELLVDEFDQAAIWRSIHEFYVRKEYPTLQELPEVVHQKGLFQSGKTSLKLLLKEMGFRFKKYNGWKFVMEQPRVITQRHSFLRKVRKYHRDGCPMIYLDKTWLNPHHTLSNCWIDSSETGEVPVKSGKGGRVKSSMLVGKNAGPITPA